MIPTSRVLVVDFSADPGCLDWGAAVVAALPDPAGARLLRGPAATAWARTAVDSGLPVILSGSDVPVPRDEPWFAGQCAEVRAAVAAGVPVLGICFGHQLIAQALGGVDAVRRAARGEFGVTSIAPLPRLAADPVLGQAMPGDGLIEVYNLHADEVSPDAAAALGLAVLAASGDCAVQAFRLPGRPVWGLQFHPEMTGAVVASVAATAAAAYGNAETDAAALAALAADDRHRRPEILAAFLAAGRAG